MNPPKHWPLDPHGRQAPRPRPGRFAARRNPNDPHHDQPPTHGGDLCPRYGTRPPLARRRRRARLPSASRLDSPSRPDRLSPHHGPRLAACRVVDYRNQGLTHHSRQPQSVPPWGWWSKIRARRWPRPVSRPKTKPPLRRLRAGGEGAAHKRPCARETTKPTSAAAHPAAGVWTAPRRNGRGLWGYAPACCGRLCESVPSSTLAVRCLYVTKDGSPTHRPASPDGASTPRLKHVPRAAAGALRPCRRGIDLARVRAQAGEAVTRGCRVGHVSIRERSACTSLSCCESWRWRGCALGFMAATFQQK